MTTINLHFPVLGTTIPADHGYSLYAALARLLPSLHTDDPPSLIGSIRGVYAGNGQLRLDGRRSKLRLRLAADAIVGVLPLAGKAVEIDGHSVRLGVPQVLQVVPAPSLVARLVTIKGFTEPDSFLKAVQRQLDTLDIKGKPAIPLVRTGPHSGKPYRRVLRVKGKRIVGYSLMVTELTADESLRLQEHGLGGRGKMGCGFLVPVSPRSS